jgi:hypothetical protein
MSYHIASLDARFAPPQLLALHGEPIEDYVAAWRAAGESRKDGADTIFVVIDDPTKRLAFG